MREIVQNSLNAVFGLNHGDGAHGNSSVNDHWTSFMEIMQSICYIDQNIQQLIVWIMFSLIFSGVRSLEKCT